MAAARLAESAIYVRSRFQDHCSTNPRRNPTEEADIMTYVGLTIIMGVAAYAWIIDHRRLDAGEFDAGEFDADRPDADD